jgi:putative DNA primase/helicase
MTRDILHKFKNLKPSGDGWTARCPAHADKRNSLSIGEGENGRLLLHCHAGCTFEAIRRAADISTKEKGKRGAREIVAAYDYRDEKGALLYQSVRFVPKDFKQRTPDDRGGWAYKLNGVRQVLYHLPELLTTDFLQPVFIVEGEKDADRLTALGFVATTNACGAGKWRADYNECLRGRRVVIIPDNDEPGERHAKQVEQSLRGTAASVHVLRLPDIPPKGDVSDWLDAGHTPDELRARQQCSGVFVH